MFKNGTRQAIFEVVIDVSIGELILTEGRAMELISRGAIFQRDFAFNIESVLRNYLK
jgi:hypothetical protein